MSVTCDKFQDSLLDLIYDELDPESSKALLLHAKSCSNCNDDLQALSNVHNIATTIPSAEVPTSFDEKIMNMALNATKNIESETHNAPVVSFPVKNSSAWDKIGQNIFKPQVAVILAAAIIVFAIVSKNKSPEENMLPSQIETPEKKADLNKADNELAKEELSPANPEPALQQAGSDNDSIDEETVEVNYAKKDNGQIVSPTKKRLKKNLADNLLYENKKSKRSSTKGRSRALPSNSTLKSATYSKTPSKPMASTKREKYIQYSDKKKSSNKSSIQAITPAESMDALGGAEALDESESDDFASTTSNTIATAKSAYSRGDCKTAEKYFQLALKKGDTGNMSKADIYYHIAKCNKRSGRCSKALTMYNRIINTYPGFSKIQAVKEEAASCRSKLGQTTETEKAQKK